MSDEKPKPRDYFVEDGKCEQIVFNGTEDECWEWCEAKSKENPERVLIIRKGNNK